MGTRGLFLIFFIPILASAIDFGRLCPSDRVEPLVHPQWTCQTTNFHCDEDLDELENGSQAKDYCDRTKGAANWEFDMKPEINDAIEMLAKLETVQTEDMEEVQRKRITSMYASCIGFLYQHLEKEMANTKYAVREHRKIYESLDMSEGLDLSKFSGIRREDTKKRKLSDGTTIDEGRHFLGIEYIPEREDVVESVVRHPYLIALIHDVWKTFKNTNLCSNMTEYPILDDVKYPDDDEHIAWIKTHPDLYPYDWDGGSNPKAKKPGTEKPEYSSPATSMTGLSMGTL